MKLRLSAIFFISLLLALPAPPTNAQSATQEKDKDLPNFHQVNEHLYRGAQPTLDGIRKLAAHGIKTILNLRGESELSVAEEKAALEAGIQYRNVPMPDYGRPKDEQVEAALDIINDSKTWPVFVHCKHGEDRTGVIIACYRISKNGKTDIEALKEAKQYGMSRFQFGMKDYVHDYFKRRSQTIQKTSCDTQRGNRVVDFSAPKAWEMVASGGAFPSATGQCSSLRPSPDGAIELVRHCTKSFQSELPLIAQSFALSGLDGLPG